MPGFSLFLNTDRAMAHINYLTEEGLKKLKDELNHLKTHERISISKQIAEARDKGDLSENAEYDAAKDAQGLLELKISKLEDFIANSRLIDNKKMDNSKIHILSRVRIRNLANGSSVFYELVPENDANLKAGKISVDSPIAKGLLGKKVGDKVDIQVPSGTLKFEIVEIAK